jgi:hypothetical protein
MLELLGSPAWVLKASLLLLALGYIALGFRTIARQGAGQGIWMSFAAAIELGCGVLALLSCSHYLLFVWAADMHLALPGLLLGLPLLYSGRQGLFAYGKTRQLPVFLLLGSMLTALLLWDSQRLWPATFLRLHAAVMGYPDLVLRSGEDMQDFVPPRGARVIFQPDDWNIFCGVLGGSERRRPFLPFRINCKEYYWGQAMASINLDALIALPALPGLASLWREEEPGDFSTILSAGLNSAVITDLQRLCPGESDCSASKQALLNLFGYTEWSEFLRRVEVDGDLPSLSLDRLPDDARQSLLGVLAQDVHERLSGHVGPIVTAYAEAQAQSLVLRDMKPSYPRSDYAPRTIGNTAKAWQLLRTGLPKLRVEQPTLGQVSQLMAGVILDTEPRAEGGVRLIYHTAVGWQSAGALAVFVVPLLWFCAVYLALLWRYARP